MSLVPPSGLLRLLYNEARGHDIEYKATAFWQAYLQSKFTLANGYAVVAEYAPSDVSRMRSDYTILQYNDNGSKTRVIIGEAKRTGTHPKNAEMEAAATAKEVLKEDGNLSITVLTTWGCSFRIWSCDGTVLVPMDGGKKELGHRSSYIDADSPEATVFMGSIIPTAQGRQMGDAPERPGPEHSVASSSMAHGTAGGPSAYTGGGFIEQHGMEDVYSISTAPWPSAQGAGADVEHEQPPGPSQESRKPAKVALKTKSRHPDSYFHPHSVKGKEIQTSREDWIRQGNRYVHLSGEYWARQLP